MPSDAPCTADHTKAVIASAGQARPAKGTTCVNHNSPAVPIAAPAATSATECAPSASLVHPMPAVTQAASTPGNTRPARGRNNTHASPPYTIAAEAVWPLGENGHGAVRRKLMAFSTSIAPSVPAHAIAQRVPRGPSATHTRPTSGSTTAASAKSDANRTG